MDRQPAFRFMERSRVKTDRGEYMPHPRDSQPMQAIRFVADNAASALAQIHEQLGPNAVVLSVRRLPAPGVSRLWHKNGRIEVLAGVTDGSSPGEISCRTAGAGALKSCCTDSKEPGRLAEPSTSTDRWKSVAWLQAMGLLPAHAERLQRHLAALHASPPASLEAEWEAVKTALHRFWPPPDSSGNDAAPQTHVFVGPPGSGKTTVLCKWLTLAVLTEERSARVWRLDGATANTAEFLTVHCEMLGVPLERFCSTSDPRSGLLFVDLPGVELDALEALTALRVQIASLPAARVHLVLNAAYETHSLLAQWRTFAAFEPEDLIFTHLDEESRRVKLWNFVFGTNCRIRFLSAGQKIPGSFRSASPSLLFPAEFQS